MAKGLNNMVDLLELQKRFILAHLRPGDVAVDCTMGNGNLERICFRK